MSYQTYNGTVSCRSGKGEGSNQAVADISAIIPVGLSPDALISLMEEKYGQDIVSTMVWNSYKILIQKAGQAHFKSAPDDIDGAAKAIVDRANSDISSPGRSQPRITENKLITALKSAGVSTKKIEQTLADLLAVAE